MRVLAAELHGGAEQGHGREEEEGREEEGREEDEGGREEEGRAEVAAPGRASSSRTRRPCDGVLTSVPTLEERPRVEVPSGATGPLGEPGRKTPAARMLRRSSLAVRGWRRAAPWAVKEER